MFKTLSSEISDPCFVLACEWRVFLGGGPELSCAFGVICDWFWIDFVSLGTRPQPSLLAYKHISAEKNAFLKQLYRDMAKNITTFGCLRCGHINTFMWLCNHINVVT